MKSNSIEVRSAEQMGGRGQKCRQAECLPHLTDMHSGSLRHKRQSLGRSRRCRQRGSALLIVLVFAAIVAIMLYKELPIAAFEAQRQKEELLISRGNEYKRGVKLFVRKVGRFPQSIEELESTNRMRFLRHRYVDPLTGKDDWRIIHAGPGGVIIDSQVKTTSKDGKNAGALGQGATFGGFNNSFSGDAEAVDENKATPSAGMRQRAPATKNAGSLNNNNEDPLAAAIGSNTTPDASADTDQLAQASGSKRVIDPNQPAGFDPATGQAYTNAQGGINASNLAGASNGDPNSLQPGAPNPNGSGISTVAQQMNNVNPQTPEKSPAQQGLGNTSAFGNNNSTNSLTGNAGNGLIGAAGGIAGVASKAQGVGIKLVNEQTKYKLWEFYYDLKKDQTAGAGGLGVNGQPNQNLNQNGAGQNNNNSVFGGTSGFGQSQQGSSSFGFGGSSNNNQQQQQQTPPPQAVPPVQQ